MDTLECSYKRVSRALDFPAEDVNGVNRMYERWRRDGSASDKYAVDVWTYCNVVGFFRHICRRNPGLSKTDRDQLVGRTLVRINRSHTSVRRPSRYASWVYVVCRNEWRTYIRRSALARDALRVCETVESYDPGDVEDKRGRERALREAVDRLPRFLADVVRLRYFDGLSYAEMSRQTGKTVGVLRAYISRGIARLRADPDL